MPGRLSALPECLVLAALLHLLLVAVFGSAPGGSARPGEGVWGALNIRIAGTGPARSEPAEQPPPPDAYSGPPGQAPERRWGGTVRDPAAPPPADTPGAARLGTWNPARTPAAADPLPPALARPAAPADNRSPPRAAPAPLPAPPPAAEAGAAIPEPTAPRLAADTVDEPAPTPLPEPVPEPASPPVWRELRATPPLREVAPLPALPGPMAPLEAPTAAAPALAPLPPQAPAAAPSPEPVPAPATAPAEAPTRTLGAAPTLASPTALPLPRPETLPALQAAATAPLLADVPREAPHEIPLAPSPRGVPSAPAPEPATAAAPAPERPMTARPALGAPDAGAVLGHDVATAPAAPASAPRLNLDLVRPRGGEISAGGSRGVLNLLPHPPETKKLADDISKSARPDCRTAYSGMGIIAAVPLAADALRKDGCRW